MVGKIRVGVGGWVYEPWRGTFYPEGLPQKRELEYASRHLTAIEINATYYSTFKPKSFAEWAAATPDDFTFTAKGSRFVTNRRELSGAGDSLRKFFDQGLTELGPKLHALNWQFATTKRFDPADFEGFLKLLPPELGGRPIRHVLEPRHDSFAVPEFYDLARRYGAAIVYARDEEFPEIDEDTAGFRYARIMTSQADKPEGFDPEELDAWAAKARAWAKSGDVYLFVISGAKERDPAAAMALIERVAT